MRINFEVIKFRVQRKVRIDGKLKRQSKTFEQTVNPWNKNEDGTAKDRKEVYEAVQREAMKWVNEIA